MTLGQRIQALRQSMNLSQEGLGEKLGVSRQAISKWEADGAVPEVDKLIALSRLFGVSLEELLGLGTAPKGPESPAPAEPDTEDLTERALERRRRRRWADLAAVLALAVGVIAVCIFAGQLVRRVNDLESQLTQINDRVVNVQSSVSDQLAAVSGRIQSILEDQSGLLAGSYWEVAGVDIDAETVTLNVAAVPKTYLEGMTASFLLRDGLGTLNTVPAVFSESDRSFRAEGWTFPAVDYAELWVVFDDGGESHIQYVETLYNLKFDSELHLTASRRQGKKAVLEVSVQVGRFYSGCPLELIADGGGASVRADLALREEYTASVPTPPAGSADAQTPWSGRSTTYYLEFEAGWPDGEVTVMLLDSTGRVYTISL